MMDKESQRVWVFLLVMPLFAGSVFAQAKISEIRFDSIPPATSIVASAGSIALEGDVTGSSSIAAVDILETADGIRFADSTILRSAIPDGSPSANQGLYSNMIPAFSPPLAYSEICFKNAGLEVDVHMAGEATDGGNCLPGDIGFIVERTEREQSGTVSWAQARAACLVDGMRLLEPFEWLVACENSTEFELEEMTLGLLVREWVSNSPSLYLDSQIVLTIPVFGFGTCPVFNPGVVATFAGQRDTYAWRCAR